MIMNIFTFLSTVIIEGKEEKRVLLEHSCYRGHVETQPGHEALDEARLRL